MGIASRQGLSGPAAKTHGAMHRHVRNERWNMEFLSGFGGWIAAAVPAIAAILTIISKSRASGKRDAEAEYASKRASEVEQALSEQQRVVKGTNAPIRPVTVT